jgi:hypothetical protein
MPVVGPGVGKTPSPSVIGQRPVSTLAGEQPAQGSASTTGPSALEASSTTSTDGRRSTTSAPTTVTTALAIPIETPARFGFSHRETGGHMSRSMMLAELSALLGATPSDAGRAAYRAAIVERNALGKPTEASRQKSEKHLYELYGLDPSLTLFRVLRYLAAEDPDSLPLIALTCAFCRDPQLRASFELIRSLKPGEILTRERMAAHLEAAFPDRYSPAMKAGVAKNCNTTWTAAGHLAGRAVKRRSQPDPRPVASAYAMLAGWLLGLRGQVLVDSVFSRLVGADPTQIAAHLHSVSRRGWLRFRHAGGVMEIDFSPLLLPHEEALLHGAD